MAFTHGVSSCNDWISWLTRLGLNGFFTVYQGIVIDLGLGRVLNCDAQRAHETFIA
jgi:hypothetical protein